MAVARSLSGFGLGDQLTVALRPEAVDIAAPESGKNALKGTVDDVAFLGSIIRVRVRLASARVSLDTFNDPSRSLPRVGETVTLSFKPEDLLLLERD